MGCKCYFCKICFVICHSSHLFLHFGRYCAWPSHSWDNEYRGARGFRPTRALKGWTMRFGWLRSKERAQR